MEGIFGNLAIGFIEVFKLQPVTMWGMTMQHVPFNILMCLIGCLLGTLIVLPGIGPVATIAALPVTFGLAPIAALIMLAGTHGSMAVPLRRSW
jgi:TctA family transporter